MSQVIIVSNRLPVSVKKVDGRLEFSTSIGGLATGLSSYVDDPNNTWIGWPGIASDDLTRAEQDEIVDELAKRNCSPVFLTQRQIDYFYNGYSNGVLWPVFHSMPLGRTSVRRPLWWQAYRSINRKYADMVLSLSETGGRVWIHDYQLLLTPEMIREERADITIGFFLHIPFPDIKRLRRVTEYKKLLRGLLGADVIGFHTTGYVANFLQNCHSIGLGIPDNDRLVLEERMVRVGNFPMGIDYQKYATASRGRDVKAAIKKYKARYKGKKVIVAVDRLDPSKGLVERLEAYESFLEQYPRMHGKVVFSMVAAPSRTDVPAYRALAKRLTETVERINSRFSRKKWQPVDYINESVPFEEVTALFNIADVAFITPLKDGMNLAAKEYVASSNKNGILILSETAGAAEELSDALIVNPLLPETQVRALRQALTMRRPELRRRIRGMRKQISTHTVKEWAEDFVEALQTPVPGTPVRTRTLNAKLQTKLFKNFEAASKRLLLLDYDGSLVPFTKNFEAAAPPKSLLRTLDAIDDDEANDVIIISGRSAADLDQWFGSLRINLVAEHGASVRKAGQKTWKKLVRADSDWRELLQPVLDKYARLAPGARVEVKPHSLVWHYRGVSPYYAQKYAVIIKKVLKPYIKRHSLEILQGNKVLEIKNPNISKGIAAENWLKRDYDFVLGVGDDMTDEILFAALPSDAYSIKVGKGRTEARYRLDSHTDIRRLLSKLAK